MGTGMDNHLQVRRAKSRSRALWITAAAGVIAIFGAATAAYTTFAHSSSCWTDACKLEQKRQRQAAVDSADAGARRAWSDVQGILRQRVSIAHTIISTAEQSLRASDARSAQDLARIEYMTAGMTTGELLSTARPFVVAAGNAVDNKQSQHERFVQATQSISDALTAAYAGVDAFLAPGNTAEANAVGKLALEISRSSYEGLATLNRDGFLTAQVAATLHQSLQANGATLRSGLSRYNAAVRQFLITRANDPENKAEADSHAELQKMVLMQLADIDRGGARAEYVDRAVRELPQQVSNIPPADTRTRAAIDMENEIRSNDSRSEALEREAAAILAEDRQSTPSPQPAAQVPPGAP
jgi:hypothetical protein